MSIQDAARHRGDGRSAPSSGTPPGASAASPWPRPSVGLHAAACRHPCRLWGSFLRRLQRPGNPHSVAASGLTGRQTAKNEAGWRNDRTGWRLPTGPREWGRERHADYRPQAACADRTGRKPRRRFAAPLVSRRALGAPAHRMKMTMADNTSHPIYPVADRLRRRRAEAHGRRGRDQGLRRRPARQPDNALSGMQTGIIDFVCHTSGFMETIYPPRFGPRPALYLQDQRRGRTGARRPGWPAIVRPVSGQGHVRACAGAIGAGAR